MIFVFSKSKKIGSKLIRWGLDEPVSHFAMVFDERPGGYGLLFHSHFSGVSLQWFNDWQRENEIVFAYTTKQPLSIEDEETFYQIFVARFYGKEYDFRAMAYWAICLAKYKMYGTELPEKNKWGEPNKFLCYEIAEGLSDIPFLKLPKIEEGDMISPYKLSRMLDRSPVLTNVSYRYRG